MKFGAFSGRYVIVLKLQLSCNQSLCTLLTRKCCILLSWKVWKVYDGLGASLRAGVTGSGGACEAEGSLMMMTKDFIVDSEWVEG